VEANASGRQLLQVQHRRNHPLAVEEIEGPAQHQIECPLCAFSISRANYGRLPAPCRR